MTLFRTLDVAASGMAAQRVRMNVAAMNLANKNTTRTEEGGPYRRRDVVLQTTEIGREGFAGRVSGNAGPEESIGVKVAEVSISGDDPVVLYDPGHPDADGDGYVATPNVSAIKEMVNMLGAARAYEAGTTVMKSVRDMAEQALRIGR